MNSRSSVAFPSMKSLDEEPANKKNEESVKRQTKVQLEQEDSIKQSNFQEELHNKLIRLRHFIQDLGQLRDVPINLELLDQLEIDEDVYRKVGYETVIQEAQKRIEKMTKNRKLKRNWSICDLKILIWLICKHCQKDSANISNIHNQRASWELISSLIPGTTAQSCLFKWLSLKRHKITLYAWSEKEEQILIQLQKKHTQSRNKWKYISEELYSLNTSADKIYRHPKQCRQHYSSFLDPHIKRGPWTKEQDLALMAHIIQNKGDKKWCKLVKILQGRTQNAIKNRFQLIFTKLKKRKQNKNKTELELIKEYFNDNGGQDLNVIRRKSSDEKKDSSARQIPEQIPIQQVVPIKNTSNITPISSINLLSSRSLVSPSAFVPYVAPDSLYRFQSDFSMKMLNKSFVSLDVFPFQDQK